MKKVIALTTDGESQTYQDIADYLDMTVTEDSNELDKLVALIDYKPELGATIIPLNRLHLMVEEQMQEMRESNSDYAEHNTRWGL